MRRKLSAFVVLMLTSGVCVHASDPFFLGLGDENSNVGFFRQAFGVSGDGSTVFGVSAPYFRPDLGFSVTDGLRWNAQTGLTRIGFDMTPLAASTDGSIIVGEEGNTVPMSGYHRTPFRWDESVGGVYYLAFGDLGVAESVSTSGGMIVGMFGPLGSQSGAGAMWTPTSAFGGMSLAGGVVNDIRALSADGKTMAGTVRFPDSHVEAAVWHMENIFQLAQNIVLLGPNFGTIRDLSADGSTLLGESNGNVFLWNALTGKTSIGFGYAGGVSADGSVVAASTGSANGAYIWDPINGQRFLSNIFQNEYGFDVSGWDFHTVTGISDDGKTLVGYGTDPNGQWEAWIAQIPEPSAVAMMGLGLVGLVAAVRRSRR